MARPTRRNPVRRSDGGAPKKKTKKSVVRRLRQRGVRRRRLKRLRITPKRLRAMELSWERATFKPRFDLEVFYRGISRVKDEAIEKAARRPSEGSGMMLSTKLRDLRFEFKAEASALKAAYRIKKAVRGVRFMLRSSQRV